MTKHSKETIQRANEDFDGIVRECVGGVMCSSPTERLLLKMQAATLGKYQYVTGSTLWAREKVMIMATEEALAVIGVDYDVAGIIERVKARYFEQFLEHHY